MAREVDIDKISFEIGITAGAAAQSIDVLSAAFARLGENIKALSSLSRLPKRLAAVTLAVEKLGISVKNLHHSTLALHLTAHGLGAIADQGERLKSSMATSPMIRQYAKSLDALGTSARRAPAALQNAAAGMRKLATNAKASTINLREFFNVATLVFAAQKGFEVLGGAVKSSMSYVEDLNLFTVSMGEMADEARRFVDNFTSVLGLDPSMAMRSMGVFNQMALGSGVAADNALVMSRNLTQLGYDLASFFNLPIDVAFEKLQSGISGEIEPLRRLGFALTQATLQEKALSLGIEGNITKMTEAQKTQLRYIQIFDTSAKMQGDLARTLISPANALRVLGQQFALTSRAIGDIFIPMLAAITPYLIAALQVIQQFANSLSSLAGFELPKFDYSGVAGMGDALDADTEAAKKLGGALKQVQTGADELHTVSSGTGGAGGAGAGVVGAGGLFDLSKYNYDATIGAVTMAVEELRKKMLGFLKALQTDPITTIAGAIDTLGNAVKGFLSIKRLDFLPRFLQALAVGFAAYGATGNPLIAVAVGALSFALTGLVGKQQQMELLAGSIETLSLALMLTALKLPLPLALALSALTTSGLVNLMGKDAALLALGSALSGIGVGLGVYKLTGNPPLAAALGILSAIIIPLIEKTTDINMLAPALVGLGTALVAFSQLKLGPVVSMTAGLAAGLISLAEFNKFAPGTGAMLYELAGGVVAFGAAMKLSGEKSIPAFIKSVGGIGGVIPNVLGGMGGALGIFVMMNDLSPGLTIALGALAIALGAVGVALAISTGGLSLIVPALVGLGTAIGGTATALLKDALPAITMFGDTISQTTKDKLTPVKEAFDNISKAMIGMSGEGLPVSEEFVRQVSADFTLLADNVTTETKRAMEEGLANLKALYGEDATAYEEEYGRMQTIIDAKKTALAALETEQKRVETEAALTYGRDTTAYTKAVGDWDKENGKKIEGLRGELKVMEDNFVKEKVILDKSAPAYAERRTAIVTEMETTNKEIKKKQDELNAIFRTAAEENRPLTEAETKEINRLQKEMLDENVRLSTTGKQEEADVNRKWAEDSAVQAATTAGDRISESLALRDEVKRIADEEFKQKKKDIEERIGIYKGLSDEQAADAITAAENERDEKKRVADEGHKAVLDAAVKSGGELYKQTGTNTGKTLNVWDAFWLDMAKKAGKGLGELGKALGLSEEQMLKAMLSILRVFSDALSKIPFVKDSEFAKGNKTIVAHLEAELDKRKPSRPPKGFADGGFPTTGDLFIANERGPEFVGSYGGASAVANNDQIVAGVAAGVAAGMAGANSEVVGALYQAVGILDGILRKPALADTDIAAANTRGAARRGMPINGNPLFTY